VSDPIEENYKTEIRRKDETDEKIEKIKPKTKANKTWAMIGVLRNLASIGSFCKMARILI
jgi:hypothetical protein